MTSFPNPVHRTGVYKVMKFCQRLCLKGRLHLAPEPPCQATRATRGTPLPCLPASRPPALLHHHTQPGTGSWRWPKASSEIVPRMWWPLTHHSPRCCTPTVEPKPPTCVFTGCLSYSDPSLPVHTLPQIKCWHFLFELSSFVPGCFFNTLLPLLTCFPPSQ